MMGEIRMFSGTFAPRNWAFCNGQLLSIAQNSALFAILGTTYGGDGVNTFALPDLRGRVPVGTGSAQGNTTQLGDMSGSSSVTLNTAQLPSHVHTAPSPLASTAVGTLQEPGASAVPAGSNQRNAQYAASGAANTQLPMSNANTGITGSNQPISLMQPYLGMNFIIALEGIFPSRN
jgi:microcystin-dependent protein